MQTDISVCVRVSIAVREHVRQRNSQEAAGLLFIVTSNMEQQQFMHNICHTCGERLQTIRCPKLLTLAAPSARMRSKGYSTQFVCVCVCVCVCVSVTSLTATPLTHRYKVRYESNANALLKVFDSWISLKILCSKVTALFAHLNEL